MKALFHRLNLSSKQLLILISILTFEIIGTISLFYIFKRKEGAMISNEFIAISREVTASIEKEIASNLEAIISINSLFTVTNSVSREQFKIFNKNTIERINSIQALEWIPIVTQKEILKYETKAHKDGLLDFKITERVEGEMKPVAKREVYYPVFYMDPLKGNEKAIGFDLGSNPTRLSALQRAIKTNKLTATSRIKLVQEKTSQKGMLVFSPVKKKGDYLGFVLGVYRIGDLITRAIGDKSNKDYNLIIYDITAEEGNQLLVQQNADKSDYLPDNTIIIKSNELQFQQIINIADREWMILLTPTVAYLSSFSNIAMFSLVISILLSGAFFYYFYRNFKGFNQQVKNQIMLEASIQERTEELKEYAHVVSHDLKSPLRNIEALVSWIKEDNKGKFDKKSLKNFNLIDSTLEKMELLITDILNYSSINFGSNKTQEVDLNIIIDNLKETLLIPKNISLIVVSKLPVIKGDRIKLQQLFQNLISNAIKFNDKAHGIIKIDVIDQGSVYQFSIEDNGIGIDKNYQKKIFKMFQVININKGSTGIGLAIVKKIITQYHGEIWVKSELGKKSTFYFTLIKQ